MMFEALIKRLEALHAEGWELAMRFSQQMEALEPEICYECSCLGDGFEEEIIEACQCIQAGKTQSEIHPMTTTIAVLKLMDEIRRRIGLHYDADDE